MSAQLELVPRSPGIPLHDALLLVADQWTRRLGVQVRVVSVEWGAGHRLERTP